MSDVHIPFVGGSPDRIGDRARVGNWLIGRPGGWARAVFEGSPFALYALNSFVVATVSTLISLAVGFFLGLIVSGLLLFYRHRWLTQIRER